jgi:hypothetical protein
MVEAIVRHAAARLQQIGCPLQRAADDQRRRRFTERRDFAGRRSAERQRRCVLIDQMAVERVTDVGQHQRLQAEGLDPGLDRLDVAGRQHRRSEHVDLRGRASGQTAAWCRDQRVDDRFDGQRKAGFEATGIVRGVHRHDGGCRELRMAGAELAYQPLHVAALGLGEPGRRQPDQLRRVLLAEHAQTLDDVLVGTHDARHLIHCRRLQRDRFAEMAHQEYLAEGRAALRAVQHRNRPAQAEEGERGADRLAGLERIDRQRLGALEDFSHRFPPRTGGALPLPAVLPTAPAPAPCATPATPASARAAVPVRACPS